jgi:hypothetical protein
MMPGDETISGMANPTQEGIPSSSSSTNNICITVDTSKEDTTAQLKQQTITMALKVMRCEERNVFIGDLIRSGMGTKEVENFISNQEYLRREAGLGGIGDKDRNDIIDRERDMVGKAMTNKLTDSLAEGVRKRTEFNNLKQRLWWRLGKKEEEKRKWNSKMRDMVGRKRKEIQKDHKKQLRQIRIDLKQRVRDMSIPKELDRYREAKIFQKDARRLFKPGEILGPVTVGLEEGLLDEDEVAVLRRGPKFCCRRIINKERFLVECEKSYCKIRWELRDKDSTDDTKDESIEEKAERERIEQIAEEEAIRNLLVFDQDNMELDYRKKRATSCKHNTNVILPRPLTPAQEQEIECRRVEWLKVFNEFMEEFCDQDGVQESNLTKQEAKGLKKLQKRVKEGTLVVVRTDKSGRFAVMSMVEYERAGNVHTQKDQQVDLQFLLENQRRINGYISMLCKVFTIGEAHKHLDRIRSLKITMSLSVAPLYLLFKDHKGWSLETGGPPPSRPVISAGGGQNDHMSEIISHVLEPVVKTMTGGLEQESSSDMMALMNEINDENHEIEDIDLESVDKELEDQERRAEERYNNFDLPTGWKPQTENPHPEDWKSQSDVPLPEGWKAGDTSTSVTATCGSVSNRVVLNSEVENIDLQNSHAGGKSEERWSLEEDLSLKDGELEITLSLKGGNMIKTKLAGRGA